MTKKNQIQTMAEAAGITYREAETAYESLISAACAALSAGGKFRLVGVGTIAAKDYPARGGYNPRTRQPIRIPARRNLVFSASSGLKRLLSGK